MNNFRYIKGNIMKWTDDKLDIPQNLEFSVVTVWRELLLDCPRELGKSTARHTKAGGKRGYLTFIAKFLP
jgi:hypothetical protein